MKLSQLYPVYQKCNRYPDVNKHIQDSSTTSKLSELNVRNETNGEALHFMISVTSKLRTNTMLHFKTYSKIYEACVSSIMEYGSGIWGYKKYKIMDDIQNRAIRTYLGVSRFAPIIGLEGEAGWLSTQYGRWLQMLRMWNHLISMPDTRLTKVFFKKAHEQACNGVINWCSQVKSILSVTGFNNCFFTISHCDLKRAKVNLTTIQANTWQNL